MKAWIVVGPTKDQPRFFGSLDKAMEAGDVDAVCGAGRSSGLGSKRQT
ncbi:hypothetical protein IFDJLNFL_3527 [Methylobacterium dankookense]|uniref:Gfo/Idh/MocA-like oxidoreductase N-terminal domain-containing protein n=1 Tax=Methylobacterium dankookense TaxID=560405 RepID=A0ABQ4RLG2_9HYPH|nr:hypothetical protein IFDJLNFL_3527 [Methylobacterium dankookense]